MAILEPISYRRRFLIILVTNLSILQAVLEEGSTRWSFRGGE